MALTNFYYYYSLAERKITGNLGVPDKNHASLQRQVSGTRQNCLPAGPSREKPARTLSWPCLPMLTHLMHSQELGRSSLMTPSVSTFSNVSRRHAGWQISQQMPHSIRVAVGLSSSGSESSERRARPQCMQTAIWGRMGWKERAEIHFFFFLSISSLCTELELELENFNAQG